MMGFLVSSAVHNIFLYLPVKIANLLNWTNWKSILYFWAGSLLFSPAIGGMLSDWKTLKGGIPPRDQVGVYPLCSYDKQTALWLASVYQICRRHMYISSRDYPWNSISLLNFAAFDIHNFAIAHNMKLNPTKCEEMFVNFLHNSNVLLNPVIRENNVIEQVKCYIRS